MGARCIALLFLSLSAATHAQEVHPDIVAVLNVTGGVSPGGVSWADSYSVGGQCYCATTFDHNIGPYYVETPIGWLTVRQACELLGPGPGRTDENPVYNDVQCGRGPPNDASDEHVCPGRVDIGEAGCGHIGPTWDFSNVTDSAGIAVPNSPPDDAHPDIRVVLNVTGGIQPNSTLANSYSVEGKCYCNSSRLDDGVSNYFVNTPLGWKTVGEICELLGPGLGSDDPAAVLYNDAQCGNGPPSFLAEGHEHLCPGRVDIGQAGCGHVGPKWNFDELMLTTVSPSAAASMDSPPSTAPVVLVEDTPTNIPTTLPTSGTAPVIEDAPTKIPTALPTLGTAPVVEDAPTMLPTALPTSGVQRGLVPRPFDKVTALLSIIAFALF